MTHFIGMRDLVAGVLGVSAMVLGLLLAVVVLRARPGRWENRILALLVVLTTVEVGTQFGVVLLTQEIEIGAAGMVTFLAVAAQPWIYLAFLGTLDSPLSRPFQKRTVQNLLVGLGFLPWLLYPLLRGYLLSAEGLTTSIVHSPIGRAFLFLQGVVFLFALLVAFSAFQRARPGTLGRSRARAYLAAFGVRDLAVVIAILTIDPLPTLVPGELLFAGLLQGAYIAFVLLLAYGILKTQLFDIDLRIKWGLEKSTVTAIFVAVFFAVSEGAQVVFAEFANNELLGVGAAALLVFAISPLQRMAERVADTAMPGVEDTEAYREERKREVYRASLEELLVDDEITAKERRMLGRLQEELGLGGKEAGRIEGDVLDGRT